MTNTETKPDTKLAASVIALTAARSVDFENVETRQREAAVVIVDALSASGHLAQPKEAQGFDEWWQSPASFRDVHPNGETNRDFIYREVWSNPAVDGYFKTTFEAGLPSKGRKRQDITGEQRKEGFECLAVDELCDDCPPLNYPTDKTRCTECPRRTIGKTSLNAAHKFGHLSQGGEWQDIAEGEIPFKAENKKSVFLTNNGPIVGTMLTNDNGFRTKDWIWWVVFSTPAGKGRVKSKNVIAWMPLPTGETP